MKKGNTVKTPFSVWAFKWDGKNSDCATAKISRLSLPKGSWTHIERDGHQKFLIFGMDWKQRHAILSSIGRHTKHMGSCSNWKINGSVRSFRATVNYITSIPNLSERLCRGPLPTHPTCGDLGPSMARKTDIGKQLTPSEVSLRKTWPPGLQETY